MRRAINLLFSNVIDVLPASVAVLVLKNESQVGPSEADGKLDVGEQQTILVEESDVESAKKVYNHTSFDVVGTGPAHVYVEPGALVSVLISAVKSLQLSTSLVRIAVHQQAKKSAVVGSEL